ncbi:MAG: hypothetical protein COB53_13145 [Elusimicrobia bacterium]|nr:MAG: hypothetical protein COB53_13145 [Elusimicrobiota bacterium]
MPTAIWAAIFWEEPISSLGASGVSMGLTGALTYLLIKHFKIPKFRPGWDFFLRTLYRTFGFFVAYTLLHDLWGSSLEIGHLIAHFPLEHSGTNHIVHILSFIIGVLAVRFWMRQKTSSPAPTDVK